MHSIGKTIQLFSWVEENGHSAQNIQKHFHVMLHRIVIGLTRHLCGKHKFKRTANLKPLQLYNALCTVVTCNHAVDVICFPIEWQKFSVPFSLYLSSFSFKSHLILDYWCLCGFSDHFGWLHHLDALFFYSSLHTFPQSLVSTDEPEH